MRQVEYFPARGTGYKNLLPNGIRINKTLRARCESKNFSWKMHFSQVLQKSQKTSR